MRSYADAGKPVEDLVHLGDCSQVSSKRTGGGGQKPLTREQAVHALTVGVVRACQ